MTIPDPNDTPATKPAFLVVRKSIPWCQTPIVLSNLCRTSELGEGGEGGGVLAAWPIRTLAASADG
jgi:hypothetical protein